ncbi:MAG: glycine cleavage system protein GcvH [Myxococcales bacterium]|nr:glycine cleavage system protein GcvH [Myxococcales bacterium]
MNIPADLKYTEHDEWIRTDGEHLVVGITDYAQDQLGELVHVELPEVGAQVSAGQEVCEVESVKAVAEIYAPVAGTVVAVNTDLDTSPESINSDPYGSWIYRIAADGEPEGLLDAQGYAAKVS